MDQLIPPLFLTKYAILVYAGAMVVLTVAYFESIPNQTAGEGIDDKIKAVYFTIRNFVFSEPEGNEWYDEYKKHPIYKKFKIKYPDSVDEFSFTINGTPMLMVKQYDVHGNAMKLTLFKCGDLMPFCYWVHCHPHTDTGDEARPFEHAFEFIDSAECLLDRQH